MKKYLIGLAIGLSFCASTAYALVTYQTVQGGTGTSTPSGIIYGDDGATTHLNTVTIGSGCTFTGGTLSCPGTGGGTFPFTPQSYGVSTTTTVGFLNGLFSTASSTFSDPFFLPTLSQGTLNIAANGLGYTTATTSVTNGTGISFSGTAGALMGGSNLTITNSGVTSLAAGTGISLSGSTGAITITNTGGVSGTGTVSTSTVPTIGQIAYWTSAGYPSLLGSVATSTLTASSPLTGSFTYIGSGGSLGCQTASGSQAGCLSSTDWTTFNNKQPSGTYLTSYDAFTHPFTSSSATTSTMYFPGIVTSASSTIGSTLNLPLITSSFLGTDGAGKVYGFATSSIKTSQLNNDAGFTTNTGTVTSVGLSDSNSTLTIGSTPVTTSGTITATLNLGHSNTWSVLQNFNYSSTTGYASFANASSTLFSAGTITIPNLGTSAGSFIAVNASGQIIATSTPNGSSTNAVSIPVQFATIAALPANTYATGVLTEVGTGVLSVDGNSPVVGNRILVKNEVAQTNNGIYSVTATGSGIAAYVLTRVSDYNSSSNVIPGEATYVIGGATLSDDWWALTTAAPITVGGGGSGSNMTYVETSGGAASVTSVGLSTPNSTLTLGGTNPVTSSGTINADLNLGHTNTWTVLQNFNYSSSTIYSSFLNASSTFANVGTLTIPNLGIAAGTLLAVNAAGQVIATATPSGSANYWTNSSANTYLSTGTFLGIGSTTPWGQLSVNPNGTTGSGVPSFAIGSSTGTMFSQIPYPIGNTNVFNVATVTSAVSGSAFDVALNGNIGIGTTTPWAQTSINNFAGLPSLVIGSSTGTSLIVDQFGHLGIGSTSPTESLVVNGGILGTENKVATSTSIALNFMTANQFLIQNGTSNLTVTLTGLEDGQAERIFICNPGSTSGTVTWATSPAGRIIWAGSSPGTPGTAPVQSTTANACDLYVFTVSQATSTTATAEVFGGLSF